MPPSSYSFNSSSENTALIEVNCINLSAKEEQLYEEFSRPQALFLILESLIVGLDKVIAVLNKSTKVDEIKSLSLQETNSQFSNVTISGDHLVPSLNNSVENSFVQCRLLESRKRLQHGMAQHDGHNGHDEPQNDSGFVDNSSGPHPHLSFNSQIDFEKLKQNETELSQCGFYFGSIDSQMSKNLLRKKPTGTFLIRDSSQSQYLYSLSVKTERGATSVRILYNNGLFQFDSDERIRNKLPQFDSVLGLLDFHVKVTHDVGSKSWQWEESSGGKSMKVTLIKPLMSSVPSLRHLSRVKINQSLDNAYLPQLVDQLPIISDTIKRFLADYPYRV